MAKTPKIKKLGIMSMLGKFDGIRGAFTRGRYNQAVEALYAGQEISLDDTLLIIEYQWYHSTNQAFRARMQAQYVQVQEAAYAGFATRALARRGYIEFQVTDITWDEHDAANAPVQDDILDVLSDAPAAPEAPAYKPGDVANGHVLAVVDGQYQWLPLAA